MLFDRVATFARKRPRLPQGVVAVLLCETGMQVAASARRLEEQGAAAIILVGWEAEPDDITVPVFRIAERPTQRNAWQHMNALIAALSGRWLLWLWNGEFFVFPYGENRTLGDLTAFLSDERRPAVFTYALDLYANDLPGARDDPRDADLCFDRIGYHAFPGADHDLRLFGGLGWRFAEYAPDAMAQIGRASLFRANRDVLLNRNFVFDNAEYNSVQCKWHHSPTAAMMTLRRSRRIMAHPDFHRVRGKLIWAGSERFDWTSRQLLELGMIEPGQWF